MRLRRHLAFLAFAVAPFLCAGAEPGSASLPIPSVGGSIVRMMGGLAFVLALFFGGVWLWKNWQRVARIRNKSQLRVIEAQSLGARHALYVVGYQKQRFLISSSPAGISLVSALPEGEAVNAAVEPAAAPASFALLLQSALGRK